MLTQGPFPSPLPPSEHDALLSSKGASSSLLGTCEPTSRRKHQPILHQRTEALKLTEKPYVYLGTHPYKEEKGKSQTTTRSSNAILQTKRRLHPHLQTTTPSALSFSRRAVQAQDSKSPQHSHPADQGLVTCTEITPSALLINHPQLLPFPPISTCQ